MKPYWFKTGLELCLIRFINLIYTNIGNKISVNNFVKLRGEVQKSFTIKQKFGWNINCFQYMAVVAPTK